VPAEADDREQRIVRLEREIKELDARVTALSRAARKSELEQAREGAGQQQLNRGLGIIFWVVAGLTVIALIIGYAVLTHQG
jgi:type VI protein secretion system component VasF